MENKEKDNSWMGCALAVLIFSVSTGIYASLNLGDRNDFSANLSNAVLALISFVLIVYVINKFAKK